MALPLLFEIANLIILDQGTNVYDGKEDYSVYRSVIINLMQSTLSDFSQPPS